jgi:hypothetical protein
MAGEITLRTLIEAGTRAIVDRDEFPPDDAYARAIILCIAEAIESQFSPDELADIPGWLRALADPAGRGW